jgi:FemAB-related protein (PEP-CTERM system-associated)
MNCIVEQIDPLRWDNFVINHAEGTFFHLWQWREVLNRSFGFQPVYLAVEERQELLGVLPLFLVRSMLFGKSAVTIPLGVYGGPIASSGEVESLLIEKAQDVAQAHRAKYLEIRGNPYRNGVRLDGSLDLRESYKQKDLYVTFLADIDPSPEVNLARIPRKQRRMVRQGERHGLKFSHDDRRLRDFYDIYAASVGNLGTPVYPYDYFQRLVDSFGAQCKIFLVDFDNKPIAAVMSFFFKDQVMPYYGGALREYCRMAPSDFMYWELLAYGAMHGCCVFDFGRSKLGTGSFDFKRHWGFEPRPLPYWYRSLNGHEIPDTSPLNPKLQWAIRIWRKLPLGVTKGLGPHIARHIP